MLKNNFPFYDQPANSIFTLSNFANVATIVAVIGVLIAFLDYLHRRKEKKVEQLDETLQAIRSVKYQLETMGEWTGYSGEGYQNNDEVIEKWSEASFKQRASPLMMIFNIEDTAIKQITLLPAVKYFTDDVNKSIAELNQMLRSFNSFLSEIRAFKFSRDPFKNILLTRKLNSESEPINSLEELLDPEEKAFAEQLLKYQENLHFKIISADSEDSKGLHYWHKKLLQQLIKLERETVIKRMRIESQSIFEFLF